MNKWVYKGTSVAGGKIYHKKDMIMMVYSTAIRLYKIPWGGRMLPCDGVLLWERTTKWNGTGEYDSAISDNLYRKIEKSY